MSDDPKQVAAKPGRTIISVLVECDGRRYRVIDNLRALVSGGTTKSRTISEGQIGRKVLDLARSLEVGNVR
jgi:hypothetical protein